MWQMGGFGPMPGQVHHFIALENETDRAYGLKRYMTRKPAGSMACWIAASGPANSLPVRCRSPTFAILGWAWRHEAATRCRSPDFPPCRPAGTTR